MKTTDNNKVTKKRWKKGESGLTNPESRTFRDAAKQKNHKSFMSGDVKKSSNLTSDALRKHDAACLEKTFPLSECDAESLGGTSSRAASLASNCTNVTFKRVIHNFSLSNVAAHKEILAVLEVVGEMIKSKSEDDSDIKYLATLMSLIKSSKVTETSHVSAVLYLLSVCIKRVPPALLKEKFGEASKMIFDVLQTHNDSDSQSLIKSAITILSTLFRHLDYSSWKYESTRHIYYTILCLTVSNKPKVRKVARHAVGAILRGSCFMVRENSPLTHPASHDTCEFCIKKLEDRARGSSDNSYINVLNLLGDILPIFTKSDFEKACTAILNQMSPTNMDINLVCMVTLKKMFAMKPRYEILTGPFNVDLIMNLFQHQPKEKELETTFNWMLVMVEAFSNLSKLDARSFFGILPRFFKAGLAVMLHQPSLAESAARGMMTCISECSSDVIEHASEMSRVENSPIHELVKDLKNSFSLLFKDVMKHVLLIVHRFVEYFGRPCISAVKNIIKPLSTLKMNEGFPEKSFVTKIFGTVVRTMGPKTVLEVLPLGITGENDDMTFPMSWLIPVFRDNLQDTELEFFIQYLLPIISNISVKCTQLEVRDTEYKVYDIIRDQLWSLLPGFCRRPRDLVTAFPKLAQVLGEVLIKSEESRLDVLHSLRNLINDCTDDDERSVLGHFAKNYVPILSTLYTSTKTVENVETSLLALPQSHAVLETFKVYIRISNKSVTDTCIDKCIEMYHRDVSSLQKNSVMDLMVGLVPCLTVDNLEVLCNISLKNINSKDRFEQKKSYRLLEEICSCQSEDLREFIGKQQDTISKYLIKSFSSSLLTSKAPRLRCLTNIVRFLDKENEELLGIIVPEAVMCTNTPGATKRNAAFALLVELSHGFIRWNSNTNVKESLQKFVEMLIAGLASPQSQMIKCTVLSVTKVMRVLSEHRCDEGCDERCELRSFVTKDLLGIIVENVFVLMKSNNQGVVKSSLELVKSLLSVFSDYMSIFIKPIVTSLVEMNDENKRHLRFKSKEIYVKLVKKFGHQLIMEMMPQSHHKIINHIRKKLIRDKKKLACETSDDESDKGTNVADEMEKLLLDTDEEDGEEETKSTKNRRQQQKDKIVFRECDEVVDFLDPSTHKNITVEQIKKPSKKEIRMKDGKLDFLFEDERRDVKGSDEKRTDELVHCDDDKNSRVPSKGSGKGVHGSQQLKKRRRSEESDDYDGCASQFSYKSGGTGIHRPNPTKLPKLKKTKGEVSKGNLQPYEYIPLDKKMLNKRFKNKLKK